MGTPAHTRNLTWIQKQVLCLKGVTFSKAHPFGYQFVSFRGMCNKVCFFVKGQNLKEKNK